MLVVGLTGSIAMGKSTITRFFEKHGAVMFDADGAVHHLYAHDAEVKQQIATRFPDAVTDNGEIDRTVLSRFVFHDKEALTFLEQVLHPRVRAMEAAYLAEAKEAGYWLAILDIPLLFETGAEQRCDKVVVVSCDYEVQKHRALTRLGMSEEKLLSILAKQWPDAKKREKADYIIDTSRTLLHAEADVVKIVNDLKRIAKEKGTDHA